MISEKAYDIVDEVFERWKPVCLKLRPGVDGSTYTGWFSVYTVTGFDIIRVIYLVRNVHAKCHINQ